MANQLMIEELCIEIKRICKDNRTGDRTLREVLKRVRDAKSNLHNTELRRINERNIEFLDTGEVQNGFCARTSDYHDFIDSI